MKPVLEFHQVSYSYQLPDCEIKVLDQLSFQVKEGEFIAIVGPSGCGKTTLLHLISGLLSPDQGRILLFGKPPSHSSHTTGYMLQSDQLLEWRTIYQNVLLGPEIQGTLSASYKERALAFLELYGLKSFITNYPSSLSGGMRQRVALIRTLLTNPDLLLLDEPFSALDYQTRLIVSNDICNLIKQEEKTAILVTHDLAEAICFADRILILNKRPTNLKKELSLSFPDMTNNHIDRRNTEQFHIYFNQIWKELSEFESIK